MTKLSRDVTNEVLLPNATRSEGPAATGMSPWALGLAAARRNLGPAVGLAAFAVTLGLSYWSVGPVREALGNLATWRSGLPLPWAWTFPVVSTAVFGAVVPWLFQQFRRERADRPGGRDLVYFSAFWGFKGAEIQLLYSLLEAVVGSGASVGIVAGKIVLHMSLYAPLWGVPMTLLAYQFRDARYSLSRLKRGPLRRSWTQWYRWDAMPVVINNWCVWIPVVMVIYTMPLPLQLPFQNLVLCFWSLVLGLLSTSLSARSRAEA